MVKEVQVLKASEALYLVFSFNRCGISPGELSHGRHRGMAVIGSTKLNAPFANLVICRNKLVAQERTVP